MLAGAARVDISPRREHLEARGLRLREPLEAKALVVKDERTSLAIVSCDVRETRWDFSDLVRRRASERTGIPHKNIVVASTHNHTDCKVWSGYIGTSWRPDGRDVLPGEGWHPVLDDLAERLVQCVCEAHAGARPVEMSSAMGTAPGVAMSARIRQKGGAVACLGSPLPWKDEIARPGPVDDRVLALRLTGRDGVPVAHVVHFGCHPTADIGGRDGIGGDFNAHAMRRLEGTFGGIALFLNGPSGDVYPVGFFEEWGTAQARKLGDVLADATISMAGRLERAATPSLACAHAVIRAPRRKRDLAKEQQELMAKRDCLVKGLSVQRVPEFNFEQFLPQYLKYRDGDRSNAQRVEAYLRRLRTMDKISAVSADMGTIAHMTGRGISFQVPSGADDEGIPLEIQAVRVGDVRLVLMPGEPFAQIGLDIRARSPFPKTAVVSQSNWACGYIPTTDDYGDGGYQVQFSCLDKGTDVLLRDKALDLVKAL